MALRLGVGWHFFKEGAKKFTGAGVPSVSFLRSSTGPLSGTFKSFIPDRFGHKRLSVDATRQFWEKYRDRAVRHYVFDSEQTKQADQLLRTYNARMTNFVRDNSDELREYFLEVERLQEDKKDPTRRVPFQQSRISDKENELWGKASPWLADVRSLSINFQKDLERIATDAQRARGPLPITDRGTPTLIDTTIKYVVLLVGVLLILGLCTRVACLAGMGFLASVIATQPPWVPWANTQFFYYQLVEVLALFVLFVFAAGQFGGLDYLFHGLYRRCCPPKTKSI